MKNQRYIVKGLVGLFLLFFSITLQATENSVAGPITGKETVQLQQQMTVKGYVRDAVTNSPLMGAKVQSKNQKYSVITNEEGYFTIDIPTFTNLIYVTAPDYSLIEYPLQSKTEVEIFLYRSLPALRVQSALTVDAQIQSILGSDVRVVNHSGAPSIGSSYFIRGFNSLNAGAQPLIVVDDVIFDNQYDRSSIHQGFMLSSLSTISADDVESVQVLKDGSSLYGSKGGNGVLIIKTRRGKDPVTQITVSSMFGYNERPKTIPMMNANQFRVYVSDLLKDAYSSPEIIPTLPFLNDNPLYYDYARYHNNNNWNKDVYRNSSTQSYDVCVSGGDNVALYNLSMGFANSNSTIRSNDFSRFNTRFNSDINLSNAIKLSFDLCYSQTDRNLRDDGFSASSGEIVTSPTALAMIKAPFLIPYEHSNSGKITADLSDADFLGIANPLSILEKGVGQSSQNYLALSIKPKYSFSKDLNLNGVFNYSLNSLFEKYFRPNVGVADIELPEAGAISHSFVKGQNTKQISMSTNVFLNWKKQIKAQAIDLTGGFRYLTDSYKGEFGSGHNTPTDLNPNLSGSLLYRKTVGYDDSWRSLSWYANGEYSYLGKYALSGAVSADASSRFGKDANMLKLAGVRWGFYPSVNASWLVSSENFMSDIPWINTMKLRLGYGLTGNDNIPNASSITYFSSVQYINEYTGKMLSNIGNTMLKPETVEKSNLGMDLSVFNNRVSLSADVFNHITHDLLTLKQFDFISGMNSYWTNEGKLQNKGFELSFNSKAIVLKDFIWELGGSIAHYKNTILELPEGNYATSIYGGEIQTSVGQPAGVFYGYKTLGVFANTQEAENADLKIANQTGIGYTSFKAGDIHFADLSQDHSIDNKDKTQIGDPNPDFTGSFNTRIAYKKLSLTALFTYSYGNDVYNYVRTQIESGSTLYNQSTALKSRWISEGQNTSFPKSSYGDMMGNNRFSDRWIEDGSYLRFKTLSVEYAVPVNSLFLSGFTVWASANNLFTLTKYLGADPECSIGNSVLYQGIDAGLLAQGKSFFVGLKLNL